jgi:outer membrane protein assembly factor BamD (BamD/ComL family)
MFKRIGLIALATAALLSLPQAFAGDAEANDELLKAAAADKSGDFRSAADLYMAAQLQADSPAIKANALMAAAKAYRNAGLLYKEFDCIERLIKGHPGKISFSEAIEREYQIGDEYFAGHRDVPFSWLPFVKEENKCEDIYEAALRNAPCSEHAPETRLRLGRIYLDDQKHDKAIKCFKDTVKLHPDTPAAKYASLELCSTLLQLSRKGDGDGKYSSQALEAFDQFLASYPKDPERPWAERAKEEVKGIIARRLNGLASYYHRMGKDEVAERYLTQVIKDYPSTEPVNKSEDMLAKIDQSYKIAPDRKDFMPEPRFYQKAQMPAQDQPVIEVPENSNGKWLLPVKDLRYGVKSDSREEAPKRKVEDDSL